MQLEITRRARRDIAVIHEFGQERYGSRQAEAYISNLLSLLDLLATSPYIAPARSDTQHPLRIHPYRGHVIIYMIVDDVVQILRVLSRHQNWIDYI